MRTRITLTLFCKFFRKKSFSTKEKKKNMNVEIQKLERNMFFSCMKRTDVLYRILKTLKYFTKNAMPRRLLHFRDRCDIQERRIFLEARRVRPLPLTRGGNCGCLCSCISFDRLSLCVWPSFGIST